MEKLNHLLEIMSRLRDPEHGCPWDLKQTFLSLTSCTVEEAYEVRDAIQRQDFDELKSELGDLLFQVVFYAQLAREQNLYDFSDIVSSLSDKLIRRHPHVFEENVTMDESAVQEQWDRIKSTERASVARHSSVLDDIPAVLPALIRAQKIQNRVSRYGFDWPDVTSVISKVEEELEEVRQALRENDTQAVAEELGDLMFSCVNLIRFTGNNAEQQMADANFKFEKRFRALEELLQQQSLNLDEVSVGQLELLWQQVKENE